MTDDLVAFLRARLDEDEAIALATIGVNARAGMLRGKQPPRWVVDGSSIRDTGRSAVLRVKHTWHREAAHITRHDPAHVLRDIAAKRALLNAYATTLDVRDAAAQHVRAAGAVVEDRHLDNWARASTEATVMHDLVRHFAAVYDQHPDYKDEWRP